jgi:hypothetical protein
MIINYLKYLVAKPIKLAWLLAINAIIGTFAFIFFKNISDILGDGSLLVVIVICMLITGVHVASNLQTFMEWKDGLPVKKKEDGEVHY